MQENMKELLKLRKLYALKKVYRMNSVENRKESSAEHTWSCLILADYLINITHVNLDKLRVYELLMYHDIVEIEAGDIPIHHEHRRHEKKEKETKALHKIKEEIPKILKSKFVDLFHEFENGTSIEARFAKAVDKLDATIHELDYKEDWKGWTEDMLRRYHKGVFEGFPELNKLFEELIIFIRKESYFNL